MINQFVLELLDEMNRVKSVEYHDTGFLANASGRHWKLLNAGYNFRVTDTHEHSIKLLRRVSIATTGYKGRVIVYQYVSKNGWVGRANMARTRVIEHPADQQIQTALKAQMMMEERREKKNHV